MTHTISDSDAALGDMTSPRTRPGPKPSQGARYPGGKLKPFRADAAPVLLRRMIDSARAGAGDPLLATPLGWLLLHQTMTPVQVAAGQHYARVRTRYDHAIAAPRRTSASPTYGASSSIEAGAATSGGESHIRTPEEEAARAADATRRYDDVRALFPTGQTKLIALLDRTCVENAHPAAFELADLRAALTRLALHFRLTDAIRKR